MKNNTKMTVAQWRSMVGCKINHLGREGVIASVRPDMGMMEVVFSGRRALMRPSEIR
jgi:hypothetical protein